MTILIPSAQLKDSVDALRCPYVVFELLTTMTMPHERTRAMRWMWEFLWELQSAQNLTDEERETLDSILLGHPSGGEIKQWAQENRSLAPEEKRPSVEESNAPDVLKRGIISPQDRAKAMDKAFFWLRTSNVK